MNTIEMNDTKYYDLQTELVPSTRKAVLRLLKNVPKHGAWTSQIETMGYERRWELFRLNGLIAFETYREGRADNSFMVHPKFAAMFATKAA